jgi:hypothetical protein
MILSPGVGPAHHMNRTTSWAPKCPWLTPSHTIRQWPGLKDQSKPLQLPFGKASNILQPGLGLFQVFSMTEPVDILFFSGYRQGQGGQDQQKEDSKISQFINYPVGNLMACVPFQSNQPSVDTCDPTRTISNSWNLIINSQNVCLGIWLS